MKAILSLSWLALFLMISGNSYSQRVDNKTSKKNKQNVNINSKVIEVLINGDADDQDNYGDSSQSGDTNTVRINLGKVDPQKLSRSIQKIVVDHTGNNALGSTLANVVTHVSTMDTKQTKKTTQSKRQITGAVNSNRDPKLGPGQSSRQIDTNNEPIIDYSILDYLKQDTKSRNENPYFNHFVDYTMETDPYQYQTGSYQQDVGQFDENNSDSQAVEEGEAKPEEEEEQLNQGQEEEQEDNTGQEQQD